MTTQIEIKEITPLSTNTIVTFVEGLRLIQNFTSLADTPNGYSGHQGKHVKVNQAQNGLIFADPTFTEQTDTPDDYAAQQGKHVRVNAAETGLEFSDPTFTEQTDTPNDYAAQQGKHVRVNDAETGLEFSDPTFTEQTDTPNDYAGSGGYDVRVKSDETGVEFYNPEHWKKYARGEAELNQMRDINKNQFAASADVHFGKVNGLAQAVNEGLWVRQTADDINRCYMGYTATDKEGTSETDFPVIHIAGINNEIDFGSGTYGAPIKFAQAPDGRDTFNVATGERIRHADVAMAFAAAAADPDVEVVIDRHDMFGDEFFLESITQANPFAYRGGMIQDQSATMNGIATVRSNRPESYYSTFDNDEQLRVTPNFDGTSSRYLEIPPWRPTGFNSGDNLIRFKCRIDTIKGSGGIMTSNAGGTQGAVWQQGGNFSSQYISSLTVNGGTDYTINTGEEVVIEGRLNTSFGSIADVGITTFMNLSYATTYATDGAIWDIELIDNLDPSNSRTYAVREIHNDGDLATTAVQAGADSAVISELWDDFTIVGNNITIDNGVLNCTGTTTNAVQVRLDTRSLANDIDLVVQFDVDEFTGGDCSMYVYREGAGDANIPFGAADVGTTKTIRYTGGSEFNVANQITIFQNPASGSTFTLSNLRIWQEVDGTLVNFPTEAWKILSGTVGGGSAGRGVDFWAATDQEKIDMVSDNTNNIFLLDDGRVVQWRMRQRTIAGAGNGDWSNIDPSVGSSNELTFDSWNRNPVNAQGVLDTPLGISGRYQNTVHPNNAHPEVGAFTTFDQSSAISGECYFRVWGVVRRLNQGAYHPSFNPLGAAKVTDGLWHESSLITDISSCFANADTLTGKIDQASGRDDGRAYDAIYAGGDGGVNDHRLSAWDMSSKEDAAKVFQKVVNGTYRGEEQLKITQFNGSPWSTSSTPEPIKPLRKADSSNFVGVKLGDKLAVLASDGITWQSCYVVGFNSSNELLYSAIDGSNVTRAPSTAGMVSLLSEDSKSTVSGEFRMVDIFGNPAEILNIPDLANGWQGGWAGIGVGNPEPLTRKSLTTSGSRTSTTDGGLTWTTTNLVIDGTANTVTTSPVSSWVSLQSYTAFAKQTVEANNESVLNAEEGVGDVYVQAGYWSIEWGNLLTESLLGKVGTSSVAGTGGSRYKVKQLTLRGDNNKINDSTNDPIVHEPINTSAPNNDSPAVKALWHQTSNNGQASLNFAWNELVYNSAGTVGNEWGDTTPSTTYTNATGSISITDGTGTYPNLNGDVCLRGTATLSKRYGYTKNRARAGTQTPGVDL